MIHKFMSVFFSLDFLRRTIKQPNEAKASFKKTEDRPLPLSLILVSVFSSITFRVNVLP